MSAAAMPQPAKAARGVRVDRIPSRPPHLTDDGQVAVPLWVLRDGRHLGDTEWRMSRQEAAELADRLRGVLATGGPR